MAKKTKDETVELLYINEEPTETKQKPSKKNKKRNKNVPKKTVQENEIINLDNEIIIGLTPKPKEKEVKSKKEKENQNIEKKQSKERKAKQVNYNANTKKKSEGKNNNAKAKLSRKPIIRIKILKWTGIFILLIGIVIFFMLSPIFNVKQINVEGVQKLTAEEIINLSEIKLEENIFKIKTSQVAERIESLSYVESVEITKELPKTVKLTIKERKPKFIIELGDRYAYIDSKGYILEISEERLELPILYDYSTATENIVDFENTKKLSDEDCRRIEMAEKIVSAAENNNILSYITSVSIEDGANIKVNLDAEKKVAYLGDCSNANIRVLYLKKMIEEEAGKEGEAYINGDLHTKKPKPYFREKI